MKLPFSTSCLLFHSFWHDAVEESLHMATAYDKLGNGERFLAHINDALDAAFRSVNWANYWRRETFNSLT